MIPKVFLIDDDPLSIFLTRFTLNQVQFAEKIETYQEARSAFEDLQSGATSALPQAIFLDLNMPGMNGRAFLEALAPKQADLAGQVKIYILTSSMDPEDQEMATGYPLVAGYLVKPIDVETATSLKKELAGDEASFIHS